MAAVAEALARQQEARGRRQAAAERARAARRPGRGRDRHRPAGRASSAGRCSSSEGARRRSRWRGGSRRGAAGRWCPSSGWPRTTTTSPRCARRRSLDASGALRTLRYDPQQRAARARPAWASCSTTRSAALVDELGARAARGPRPRRDGRARWRPAIAPGETLSGAFARLVSRLLPELVVLDPADAALKRAGGSRCWRASSREGSPTLAARARSRARACWRPATTSRCRCARAS